MVQQIEAKTIEGKSSLTERDQRFTLHQSGAVSIGAAGTYSGAVIG